MTTLKAARYHIQRRVAPAPAALSAVPAASPAVPTDAGTAGGPAAAPLAQGVAPRRPASASPASPAATVTSGDPAQLFDNEEDGFGSDPFPTAAPKAVAAPANAADIPRPASPQSVEAELEAIRKEGLTGRQLRTARRLAQSQKLPAISDHDAVRLLRQAGIDPFQRGSMLDMVTADGEDAPPAGTGRALTPLPGDNVKLPQTVKPIQLPSTEQRAEVNHAAEILKMQNDIAKRRRRKLSLLMMRMFVFILLPTIVAAWYFTSVATQLYATKSEFVIQQAEPPQAAGLGGLLTGTGMATSQDSTAVQGYLQSRDAMLRLEKDHGFRTHFQAPEIDALTRLPADASLEQTYKLYKRYVLISYDPSEGIIKLEVAAPTPELSAIWSKQLIEYAEEQVDQLTQRLREDSMKGARESYEAAEKAVTEAQQRVVDIQERFKVLSSDVEVSLLTQQIGQLDSQLMQEKLSLAQMESNPTPNEARMQPVRNRIATLSDEIANLRMRLTEGSNGDQSLARIQGELQVAQGLVTTRQMILAKSLESMENARIEANRQVRYLSLSVSPVPPDEPTYPRAFENTLVTMLILLGIYLMISMTLAILREQVTA